MSATPEYKVMGEDGHEYGPVPAAQIRQWIMEQRLDKKSPVLPPGGKDWVFLGQVAEFDSLFNPPKPVPVWKQQLRWLIVAAVAVGALVVYVLAKLLHRH
jgi:GYF domain 2